MYLCVRYVNRVLIINPVHEIEHCVSFSSGLVGRRSSAAPAPERDGAPRGERGGHLPAAGRPPRPGDSVRAQPHRSARRPPPAAAAPHRGGHQEARDGPAPEKG